MEDIVSDSIKNLSDEFFTLVAKLSVDVLALDQEHVHSDLEWHLVSDLENGLLIHVDFGLELFSLESVSILNELVDSFFFLEDEKIVVVHFESKLDSVKIFLNGLRDFTSGNLDDLIILLDWPEMHLITPGDSVLWSWEVHTLVDNHTDDHDELLLNILGLVSEDDALTINDKFQGDEVVLECSVSIVLSLDNIIWDWIGRLFEALDEVHVLIDRLLDQLTDLVGHQCGGTLEECLGLILVEVLKLFSEDVDGTLVPVRAEKSLDLAHLLVLVHPELLEGLWLLSWLREVDEGVVLVVLPELHELEGGLRANAEVLTH